MADTLSSAERSALMAKIRSRDTEPELRVRKRLHALGFRFRLYRRDLPGTPDIVLPRYRTVIMVHGCLWHGHRFCIASGRPKSNVEYWRAKIRANRERDGRKGRELKRLGWRVIKIWECETKLPAAIHGRLTPLINRRSFGKIMNELIFALCLSHSGAAALCLLRVNRIKKRVLAAFLRPARRSRSECA